MDHHVFDLLSKFDEILVRNPRKRYNQFNCKCDHPKCNLRTLNTSEFCGNHIHNSSNGTLLRELVSLHYNPESNSFLCALSRHRHRQKAVKTTLAFRYIVEMNDDDKNRFLDTENIDCCFEHARPLRHAPPSNYFRCDAILNKQQLMTRWDQKKFLLRKF